jgi:hypothetical protein
MKQAAFVTACLITGAEIEVLVVDEIHPPSAD